MADNKDSKDNKDNKDLHFDDSKKSQSSDEASAKNRKDASEANATPVDEARREPLVTTESPENSELRQRPVKPEERAPVQVETADTKVVPTVPVTEQSTTPRREETKPTFEDVIEYGLAVTRTNIWNGNDIQSVELRRILANSIGTLVRDSYRWWKLRQKSEQEKLDNEQHPIHKLDPANPLEGVDLEPNLNPDDVVEMTAQSNLVQHGPVVSLSGEVVVPEMRTVSDLDLAAATPPDEGQPVENSNQRGPAE